jgi:predicted ATPase/DNA-binding SARP family transcriptional activator
VLTVSVLGPVEVRWDGEPLPVRPGKTTEVLIRLALEAGAAVRAERLIEDLWGEHAVATQKNTLQTKVSRLRKELGDGTLVVADAGGYTLRVDPAAVDALDVVQRAASVRDLLAAGDAASALQTGTDALAAFRGEVLAGAGDGEWVLPHRIRLGEVRLQLVEDVIGARLELGATGEVTGELEALVAEHPLRERAWALLITALYRDGRQADALATYTRVRTVLADELGLVPGPELRALEQQVLEQDPALAPVTRVVAGNLPALTSTLVGRGDELAELGALVDAERLVTIVGPAGVGKTRLAVEIARAARHTAGTWLVRLEVATGPETVAATIAAALQVTDARTETLLQRLRGADLLLVLDNCEHVVDAVADLVPRLLDVAPELGVLCTSQVPLGLQGEIAYELRPLAIDAAVELFAQRAEAQRRTFTLDGHQEVVREVCGALDGLPLAIELAAARAKALSVDDIARRLDDRFTLLRDTTTRRPSRRHALATAIEWSYDLLFPDDQQGLWSLSCFTGGATLPAVEHVLATLDVPTDAALDVIDRLVHRSLTVVDPTPNGSLRYRLLDSVRAYAADRLREAGADVAGRAVAAHASWYGDAADTAGRETRGPGQATWLAFVRDERANIDVALASAAEHDPALALRIADGFGWAWVVAGDGALAVTRLRCALDAGGDTVPASDRARVWSHVAWLAAGTDVGGALTAAENAVALAEDDLDGASARLALAFVTIQDGHPADALVELDACRAAFAHLDAPWEEGSVWVLTAHAALASGDAMLAAHACAAAEPLVRSAADDWGLGHLEAVRGRVAMTEGRFGDATVHLRGAADAAARLGFATSEGYHLVNLGGALHEAGDDEQACTVLRRAVDIGTTTAELRLAAIARTHLGRVLLASGDRVGARAALTTADAWFRSSGGGDGADLAASLLQSAGT